MSENFTKSLNTSLIKVENISKAYQLGQIGTGTLSQDLHRWYARIRGKEDPFLKIGETNNQKTKSKSNIVWSLKDINFEIEQGDAVGIIGRNGAGKSTLLKILSRITAPTTGRITGKGRIASLLEVGTGFHPELSGRENIFLNGAILGMRKKEIQRKLEEIVDFAGIERYIDTPVKKYSSGMYVRLAFAVAAHLESEILIVDEVLAVGDLEFQKKCLGKMNDVSKGEGRTVLFVSHNMGSIKELCTKAILLDNGQIVNFSDSKSVISQYINLNSNISVGKNNFEGTLVKAISFKEIRINNNAKLGKEILPYEDINITVDFDCLEKQKRFRTSLSLFFDGVRIFTLHDLNSPETTDIGKYCSSFFIPGNLLRSGQYLISIGGHDGGYLGHGNEWIFGVDVATFTIAQEYSVQNDFASIGLINVPHLNNRVRLS